MFFRISIALLAAALAATDPVAAQVPLSEVNKQTTVRDISFRQVGDATFRPSVLQERIWHDAPNFWDKIARILPFVTEPQFPFSPIELQRDVVRLERYYERQGFLHPNIDYPASQVDTSSNTIHIIFTIREGPPLILQDIGFFANENTYVAEALDAGLQERWMNYRDEVTLETGRRYTEFEGIRLQDQVLSWFKNSGFAFAKVSREAIVDSSANTVDLRFEVDPGPRGYVSEIQIEGNESVSDQVVLRELPFKVGDRFSAKRLEEGQRELYELNLFRLAVAEVPSQPEDSTVIVRYRLREAQPRHVTAHTGYGLDQGALVQGSWTHRNFLGGARLLTASATYSTGYGAATVGGIGAPQQKAASVTLRQPYLFTRKLSGSFSPSYVRGQNDRLNLRYEEVEVNTILLYTIYNFRTITLRHSVSRATPLDGTTFFLPNLGLDEQRSIDIFNHNSFTLSANLGKVDDYFRPTTGFRIRPLVEMGGVLVRLKDDVDYFKAQNEAVGYLPVGGGYSISGRLFLGHIWPRGESMEQIDDRQIEYRFDRIRYYAGGANDVRGWAADLLGPKVVRIRPELDDNDEVVLDSLGFPVVAEYNYEPVGGLAKIAANIELRTPMPLLGSSWKGAVFLDIGQVFPSDVDENIFRIRDIRPSDVRLGTGAGLRYETLVGFIRFDVGYKINPTTEDLADPEQVYRARRLPEDHPDHVTSVDTNFRNRFRFHLSIGQTF